jgi:heme/copper-type cytochrome/quinol oxidase subunit 3
MNTVILLSSGVTITLAHKYLILGKARKTTAMLALTIYYGLLFTLAQLYEYTTCFYTIKDSVFGSLVFVITGFHGFHVLLGTFFLFVCLIRHCKGHFIKKPHIGFEAAI